MSESERWRHALAPLVRAIPDYPRPGILFRDITTLLRDADGLKLAVDGLAAPFKGVAIDAVAGIEARGFILGGAVACALGTGFIPLRKRGKLPAAALRQDYALEYGVDAIEVHADAVAPGQKILLIDDLIATGGSAEAAITLIRRLGGECAAAAFVIDLPDLGGMKRLQGLNVPAHALIAFAGA
jgi:adenine phosphoribosyltransferase